jgi:uncharacterized cofD-like protein
MAGERRPRSIRDLRDLRRWLRPGMGVKRWLVLVFVGLLALGLGGAVFLRQIARDASPSSPLAQFVDAVTFQFLPIDVRVPVLGLAGLVLVVVGSYRLIRALMEPFRSFADPDQPLVEVIYQKRFLSRGPKIVAIGGGTGLSALLRGLKEHTSNLTAVVTVADDGGSSGVLREVLGIPPVGDIRNCIVALADAEPLMGDLLQYRFPPEGGSASGASGSREDAGPDRLAGHAVGNLLIAAMTAIEGGDFEEGVRQVNRVLAVRGSVLPASPTPITLHARLADGSVIVGQSLIARTGGIAEVWISPDDVHASDDALRAIAEADAIVFGPGSLFTSILPSLLLPDIRAAVTSSSAVRVFVCNVATQQAETSGFDLADHVAALERQTERGIADVVLANNQFRARVPGEWRGETVRLRWPHEPGPVPKLVLEDVVDPDNAHHHDPVRLAAAVLRTIEREAALRRRARDARSA